MQASLGISQLNKLEKTIKNKITQGAYYNVLLEDHKDKISLQPMMKDMTKNHFWVFGVLLNKQNKRDKVMEKLLDKKIETRPFFWPLHLQPALGDMYKSKVKKLKTSKPTAVKIISTLENLGILKEISGKKRDRSYCYDHYLEKLKIGTELN